MEKTLHLTTAQAIVKFLDNQYVSFDGAESKFVEGFFTVFGHGIAVGLGEALDSDPGGLKVFQGRNEQGMCHAATAFAKQNLRRRIIACASSIGPGAANMVTAAATATVNNLPLLVFPADTFASRRPDPVLQQLERDDSLAVTTNDAFRPVCRYWDRITRPEMAMSALLNAMRVLTDPADTGACCISLCQDAEGEAYDFPESFFRRRVHIIPRQRADETELLAAAETVSASKRPLLIVGGGVKYSEAGETVEEFCREFGIPFAETQAGKSACAGDHPLNLGGIGVTGTSAANEIAGNADLVIAVGTRLTDFTTCSKTLFAGAARFISLNVSRYHAYKSDSLPVTGDAKASLTELARVLRERGYRSGYSGEIESAKAAWSVELARLSSLRYDGKDFTPNITARDPRTVEEFRALTGGELTQTGALGIIHENIPENSVIITAGGSLPSDLQRMWVSRRRGDYHAEYGYSCMGYEVAAALGVKLAEPDAEVYSLLGDGSFLMLHSEIATIMQERLKVTIIVFDNCGFGCINNLQMNNGVGSLATEFRYRGEGRPDGGLIPVDYAKIAEGYGLISYTCRDGDELKAALADAGKRDTACLLDLKILPKTMTDGYLSRWDVGVAQTSRSPAVEKSAAEIAEMRRAGRKY